MDILKSKAQAFLQAVSSNNIREGYDLYVGENFKHHNVYYKGDAESLKTAMEESDKIFPNKKFEIKQMIREGNFVVAHSCAKLNPDEPGYALIHIFRFENEMIVELWDLGQQIPSVLVNENGPF